MKDQVFMFVRFAWGSLSPEAIYRTGQLGASLPRGLLGLLWDLPGSPGDAEGA